MKSRTAIAFKLNHLAFTFNLDICLINIFASSRYPKISVDVKDNDRLNHNFKDQLYIFFAFRFTLKHAIEGSSHIKALPYAM